MADKLFQAQTYKPGTQIEYTPAAAVDPGDVVVIGDIVAYAPEAIAASVRGFVETEGAIHGVSAEQAWTQGAAIYWDADGDPYQGTAGTGCFTTSAVAGNKFAGYARLAKASDAQTGVVQLTAKNQVTVEQPPGASTAAAGSTTADAGVLPAATARVYPTTAADDTRGVRVHANDKIAGRMLFIGNGVSNKILKVYAPSGGTINGAAADAAFSSASGKGVVMFCLSASGNTWLAW